MKHHIDTQAALSLPAVSAVVFAWAAAPEFRGKGAHMAKEKTDTSKQGWFARWRERRARKKQRAIEITNRMYEERFRDEGRVGPGPGGG
jgi:hypothetical protein